MFVEVLGAAPTVTDLFTGVRLITSIAGILLISFLASRLLGARRSVGFTIGAGLLGWLAGAVLAYVLARTHEGGDAGFVRNLWLFATFFTMSAIVWMELLAKPGTLAKAQSLFSGIPHPFRSTRRKSQRVARYIEITRIAARHGLGRAVGLDDEDGDSRAPFGVRLRGALEEAGGVFVKLGQVMSTRSDLFPPDVVSALSQLQDRVRPAPRDAVAAMLDAELGTSVEDVFAEFDWDPIAAASIGQAYRARLRSGELVIVKVLRPGITESVERDLDVLQQLGRAVAERVPWAAEYDLMGLVAEFSDRLREELDFHIEARNATDLAQRNPSDDIVIPKVFTAVSTRRVLVVERLDGVSVRLAGEAGLTDDDREELAEGLLRYSLHQMVRDGEFHADPHPGNVLLLTDGRLGLIDFGAVARLDPVQQTSLRDMLFAVGRQDASLLRQAILDVAIVRSGFDDDLFERALGRFMARHLGPGATPSAAMFNELLQLMVLSGVVLPPEFSTFFRALVTLEGTLTTLSPGYQVIDAAQRIAGQWVEDSLSPATVNEFARDELVKLAPLLRRLPRHVDRLAAMAGRGDLRFRISLFSVESDVRVVTRLVNRVLLGFLGGIVGVMSVILIGIKGGPDFTGKTSLYEFFGYFGLFCSSILIMRVLIAILTDGLN